MWMDWVQRRRLRDKCRAGGGSKYRKQILTPPYIGIFLRGVVLTFTLANCLETRKKNLTSRANCFEEIFYYEGIFSILCM